MGGGGVKQDRRCWAPKNSEVELAQLVKDQPLATSVLIFDMHAGPQTYIHEVGLWRRMEIRAEDDLKPLPFDSPPWSRQPYLAHRAAPYSFCSLIVLTRRSLTRLLVLYLMYPGHLGSWLRPKPAQVSSQPRHWLPRYAESFGLPLTSTPNPNPPTPTPIPTLHLTCSPNPDPNLPPQQCQSALSTTASRWTSCVEADKAAAAHKSTC